MKRVLISSGIILVALFMWACENAGNEILSLTASDSLVVAGGSVLLVCTAADDDGDNLSYIWKSASGTLTPNGNEATWVAPLKTGIYFISCTVVDGAGASDAATIAIEVIIGNTEPVIISLTADNTTMSPGGTVSLTCTAEDDDGDILTYSWECTEGSLAPNDSTATWTASDSPGTYSISCSVFDGAGASDTATIAIEILSAPITSVSGKVLNAVDESPVANVSVTISGQTGTTDTNGNYTILNVGTGNHDVAGASDGFCPFSAPLTIPDGYEDEFFTYNFAMSPMLEGEQIRMVLTWGATPRDLDAHLLTPEIEGNPPYHIFYNYLGSYTTAPYAKLDLDEEYSFGPETITINQLFSGTYTYYIHNYAPGGSSGLKNSNAVVQIYSGEACTSNIIEVPTDTNGLFWHVCDIDGATGDITVVNQIQSSEP